jgi:hypothetical protein
MLLSWELDGLLAVVADVRWLCEAQAGSGKGGEGLPHLVALPARTTLSATHVHM